MKCEFANQVSMLIDGELDETQAAATQAHLKECSACQRLHEEFLFLRGEIKQLKTARSHSAYEHNSRNRRSREVAWWRKPIAIPSPVFALLLIGIGLLVGWAVHLRSVVLRLSPARADIRVMPAPAAPVQAGLNLASFDRGARAEVLKVKRNNATNK